MLKKSKIGVRQKSRRGAKILSAEVSCPRIQARRVRRSIDAARGKAEERLCRSRLGMLPGQQEHALSGVGAAAKRLHTPLRLRRPPPAPTNRKPPRASERAQPPLAQTATEPPAASLRTAGEGQARQGCRRASVGTPRHSHPSISPPLAAPDCAREECSKNQK